MWSIGVIINIATSRSGNTNTSGANISYTPLLHLIARFNTNHFDYLLRTNTHQDARALFSTVCCSPFLRQNKWATAHSHKTSHNIKVGNHSTKWLQYRRRRRRRAPRLTTTTTTGAATSVHGLASRSSSTMCALHTVRMGHIMATRV